MRDVLLINEGPIPHYRIAIYNYLHSYLLGHGFALTVLSEGISDQDRDPIQFRHAETVLSLRSLRSELKRAFYDVAIFWVGPRLYMIPIMLFARAAGTRVIHWGHRRPLSPFVWLKLIVYNLEHWLDDAIILYSTDMRRYIPRCFHSKSFIANNTLCIPTIDPHPDPGAIRRKYGISTRKNIICMGRMQRRKRIDDLIRAFNMLEVEDAGLILAGPDSDGILGGIGGRNIFKVGPIYGQEKIKLLSLADVYCLPGAIGLSIVDAFHCGLPVVTENLTHGPEIMYLKHAVNGFIVPKGDVVELAAKLRLLLTDDALRDRFARAARTEICTNGHIDRMCEGFLSALRYVSGNNGGAS